MSKTRTYQNYKDFFDEVLRANKLQFYEYSFTLLFSFLEDRVNKIYKEEYEFRNTISPRDYEMKQALYSKVKEFGELGIGYHPLFIKTLDVHVRRRNEIVHDALFNINSITKEDIRDLTKFCREVDRLRTRQKERLGQHKRSELSLRFSKSLPDLSTFRRVKEPSAYPLSKKKKINV